MWLEVPGRRVPGALVLTRRLCYFPDSWGSQAAACSFFPLQVPPPPCPTLTPDQVSENLGSFQEIFIEVLLSTRLCASF